MKKLSEAIAERLKLLMEEKGLSATQLAQKKSAFSQYGLQYISGEKRKILFDDVKQNFEKFRRNIQRIF